MNRLPAEFRAFWRAHTISIAGSQLTMVALPVAAFAVTHRASSVGIVAAAETAAALVAAPALGAVADLTATRRLLVWSDLARAGALAAVAAALVAGRAEMAALVAGAVALGAFGAAHGAAAVPAVAAVVDTPDLVRANAALAGSEAAGTAAGPAASSALLALGGPALALGADAVSFVVSAAWTRRLPGGRVGVPAGGVFAGFRLVVADRVMVAAVAVMAAMNVLAVLLEAQFVPYAVRDLRLGEASVGLFFAAGGAAALVASWRLRGVTDCRFGAIVAGVATFAAGVAIAGAVPSVPSALVAFVCAGAGSMVAMAHFSAMRQQRFPRGSLGRVAAATRVWLLAPLPAAHLAGGWLADRFSSPAVYTAGALTVAVAVGAATLAARRASPADRPDLPRLVVLTDGPARPAAATCSVAETSVDVASPAAGRAELG